ncbi:MAG: aminotransferase class I/II-fold pyridoxal phosphate-dependent enzyme [Treponema sp.]|jgi:cystathionine beta-lyase|nr:aminotransferase class I/II-fold pyridoxal phosphate-dependent enzyme [Treponema sp.]
MKYDFDEKVDRLGTNSIKREAWKTLLLGLPPDYEMPYPEEDYALLWVADMDFAVAPEILSAMHKRLDRRILGYTSLIDFEYQNVLAAWAERRYGWHIKPEQMLHSKGSIPGVKNILTLVTRPGDKVLLMVPSYSPFKTACDMNGLELAHTTLLNDNGYFTIDWNDFETKAKDPMVKAFILCSPHNPTGRVWTETELRKMGEICIKNNVFIISDEIHGDLIRVGKKHIPIASLFPQEKTIAACFAPSKTFNLAGNEFANVIVQDPGIASKWDTVDFNFMVNPLSVAAAIAAYSECDSWLEQLKEYIDGNLAFLENSFHTHLPKAIFKIPEGTYLAWIDVSAYCADISEKLSLFIAKHAPAIIENGSGFIGGSGKCIRINAACPRSSFIKGIEGICNTLKIPRNKKENQDD